MITMGYIISFISFFMLFICSIYLFLYHKKMKWYTCFGAIVFSILFLIFVVWDAQVIREKSEIAVGLINEQNQNEKDVMSQWNKEICCYEQQLMNEYQWDKNSIELESGSNINVMIESFQNVLFQYLVADKINDLYRDFVKDKSVYLGRYCEIKGNCHKISDGTEIIYKKVLFSENPNCRTKTYYCTYENSSNEYIVLQPDYNKNMEKTDIYYLYGMYAGEIMIDGKQYDFFVMNQ